MLGFGKEEKKQRGVQFNNRAWELTEAGKFEEALPLYGQAIALNPRSFMAHTNRAVALVELGRVEEALEDLEAALAINPEHQEALFHRGRIQRARGEMLRAIEDLSRAIELGGEVDGAIEFRARSYQDIGEHALALEDYRLIRDRLPEYYDGHYGFATCAMTLHRWPEAVEGFAAASRLKPEDSTPCWCLGHSLAGLGQLERALEYVTRAIVLEEKREKFHPAYYETRRDILRRIGRQQEAARDQKRIEDLRQKRLREVAAHGKFVWGAVVQANTGIFEQGTENCWGLVAFTFQRVPALAALLRQVVAAVGATKGIIPANEEERELSLVTTVETAVPHLRVEVPARMTGGVKVFCQAVALQRDFLHDGVLHTEFVPCVAEPEGWRIEHLPWKTGEKMRGLLGEE